MMINVGGYAYETLRETLIKSPTLNDKIMKRELNSINDIMFVDRDGLNFNCILNFLRSGYIWAVNKQHAQILRIEAEYYNLPDAILQLEVQENTFDSQNI